MFFVFDTETSGLPRGRDPKKVANYDSARLVSVSWRVLDSGMGLVLQKDKLVRPVGFYVSPESTAIHGITHDYAISHGEPVVNVLKELHEDLCKCKVLVAHNISFDIGIVQSEAYRSDYVALATVFDNLEKYCTMEQGKKLLQLRKRPKLAELHKLLYEQDITNAHSAEYDTYYCARCFEALSKLSKNKKRRATNDLQLTEQQQSVIDASPCSTTLVIACAGSGKTTTIVHRIKKLIEQVPEDAIMLTTFTRDAANDMERKLCDVLSKVTHNVSIGTIDSLALRFVKEHAPEQLASGTHSVAQYAPLFLKFLKTSNGKAFICNYKHLLVDEFQDINEVQYEIIKEFHKNGVGLTAVGDDAQNIYSFRGSDIKYTLRFKDYFPGAQVIKLTTNFRSTPDIVSLANASIEMNEVQIPKAMNAISVEDATKPSVHYFEQPTKQYEFIKDEIQNLQASKKIKLEDIAILCPQNVFLFQMEEVLTKHGIPNVLLDGARDNRTTSRPGHVCLTTIHKAKGLEWHTVFLIMMNDTLFPPNKGASEVVESRRLFYVGVTRAKARLVITYTKFKGSTCVSRFVSELADQDVLQFQNMPADCFTQAADEIGAAKHAWASKIARHLVNRVDTFPSPKQILRLSATNYAYPQFVVQHDICQDFEIFLAVLAARMVAERTGTKFVFPPATQALSAVKLDFKENLVYQRYKRAIADAAPLIRPMMHDFYAHANALVKAVARASPIGVAGGDIGMLLVVLRKIAKMSKANALDVDKVPVFTDRFLPKDFEANMRDSLQNVCDASKSWKDVMADVWELAKCQRIVRDHRRRLLYKDIPINHVLQCTDMFANIESIVDSIVDLFHDPNAQAPTIREDNSVTLHDGTVVMGEIDVLFNNTDGKKSGVLFKCSLEDKIAAEHLLEMQLVCKNDVSQCAIVNVLLGTCHIFSAPASSLSVGVAPQRGGHIP